MTQNEPVPTMIDWHDNTAKDARIAALTEQNAALKKALAEAEHVRDVNAADCDAALGQRDKATAERDKAVTACADKVRSLIPEIMDAAFRNGVTGYIHEGAKAIAEMIAQHLEGRTN